MEGKKTKFKAFRVTEYGEIVEVAWDPKRDKLKVEIPRDDGHCGTMIVGSEIVAFDDGGCGRSGGTCTLYGYPTNNPGADWEDFGGRTQYDSSYTYAARCKH